MFFLATYVQGSEIFALLQDAALNEAKRRAEQQQASHSCCACCTIM
jgi:hypothetical protein